MVWFSLAAITWAKGNQYFICLFLREITRKFEASISKSSYTKVYDIPWNFAYYLESGLWASMYSHTDSTQAILWSDNGQ